uniref:C-type lectin domain-containing protein n=1 Tax=Astyanax mexicanus TaxID=7994 RepID=W5L5Y1_ASTMX
MNYLIKLPLLFAFSVASAAFAANGTPTPDWDQVVKDSLQTQQSELEHFSLYYSSCSPDCPKDWVTFNRRCFKYFGQEMDWASAEDHCLSLGANLASIHNENEYQLVKALIRGKDPNENPVWIGLSACQKKYMWIWADGANSRYTNWNSDEPNYTEKECCVHMNFGVEKNWNDIPCSLNYPFVCVKKLA